MSNKFEFVCARPEHVAECVHDALVPFVAHRAAVVIYGALAGVYLEDVADDPERVDEWAAGDELWLDRAQSAYRAIVSIAPGSPVRVYRRRNNWALAAAPVIPREMLSALSSFGTDPLLWTTITESPGAIDASRLMRLLDRAPFWMAHGYKESHLTLGTRESLRSIARIIGAHAVDVPFRPHRVSGRSDRNTQ